MNSWQPLRETDRHDPNHDPDNLEAAHRALAYASIELIRAQVLPLLAALRVDYAGDLTAALVPEQADYAEVFVEGAIAVAQAAYTALWTPPPVRQYPSPVQSEILVFVAPAGMLATENELSREFPGGYRAVARWLQPNHIWVAWKYVEPGQRSGLAMNGLVWVNGHWAWFPKPFRVLAALADAP